MEKQKRVRNGRILGSVTDAQGCNAPICNALIQVFGPLTTEEAGPTRDKLVRNAQAQGESRQQVVQYELLPGAVHAHETHCDSEGEYCIEDVKPGFYIVCCDAFHKVDPVFVEVKPGCLAEACFQIPIHFVVSSYIFPEDCGQAVPCALVPEGTPVMIRAECSEPTIRPVDLKFEPVDQGRMIDGPNDNPREAFLLTDSTLGRVAYRVILSEIGSAQITATGTLTVLPRAGAGVPVPGSTGTGLGVTLRRTAVAPTVDQPLWVAIRNRTRAISFSGGYQDFIDRVIGGPNFPPSQPGSSSGTAQLPGVGSGIFGYGSVAYDVLRTATEIFLLLEAGVVINQRSVGGNDLFSATEETARLGAPTPVNLNQLIQALAAYMPTGRSLPYIERVVRTAFRAETLITNPFKYGLLQERVHRPLLLELIWSYWHEEGMLVQTMNTISRRFQNVHGSGERDPLAHFELDPLRPLNNLLWGYIQDEQNRLSVRRRTYEYQHHYGMTVLGKAVPQLRPADVRSKFLEAFHNLLHVCSVFFKEDNDTTVIADGYPMLNALKEVHLLLAQGAHNQFGDLPFTARVEMLMQEWLLARKEMRDFLQSRAMVPYPEAWMPQVDTMKTLQGWSDVTVTHYRDLGAYGEQILLSIRYGDWIDINDEDSAKNWARYWRPEIQGYLHAYRAVAGVDLTNPDSVDATIPAIHLQRRLPSRSQPAAQLLPPVGVGMRLPRTVKLEGLK